MSCRHFSCLLPPEYCLGELGGRGSAVTTAGPHRLFTCENWTSLMRRASFIATLKPSNPGLCTQASNSEALKKSIISTLPPGFPSATRQPTYTSSRSDFKDMLVVAPPSHPRPPPPAAAAAAGAQGFTVPCQAVWDRQVPSLDTSHCHPVFFTDKLRRPPFRVSSAPQSSPVAHGYVYQDAPRGSQTGAGPRL